MKSKGYKVPMSSKGMPAKSPGSASHVKAAPNASRPMPENNAKKASAPKGGYRWEVKMPRDC